MSTCCIYIIRNTKNNKFYVGSTCNYQKRISNHKSALRNNRHQNQNMQKDFGKKLWGFQSYILFQTEFSDNLDLLCKIEANIIALNRNNTLMYNKTIHNDYNLIMSSDDKKRFFNHTVKGDNGCILSTYTERPHFSWVHNGKKIKITASRAAWLIEYGYIVDGLHVCHTCNNKQCVNPKHLYLGTPLQNVLDAIEDKKEDLIKTKIIDLYNSGITNFDEIVKISKSSPNYVCSVLNKEGIYFQNRNQKPAKKHNIRKYKDGAYCIIDLTGRKFKHWTVIERYNQHRFKCRCKCGNIEIINGNKLVQDRCNEVCEECINKRFTSK